MFLAGDVGGTNTRLALLPPGGDPATPLRVARFRSNEFPSLAAIVRRFMDEGGGAGSLRAAAFGVAGPVRDRRAAPTNIDWAVDARELERELGIPRIEIRNDLQATGLGIGWLPANRFHVLNEGDADPSGNGALIAAGTGLGESILVRSGTRFVPLASEGGHADFAPRDDEQDGLLKFLRARHGEASFERVVSGPGLVNVFEYVRTLPGPPPRPEVLAALTREDPARVISDAALDGSCPVAVRAHDLFVAAYGAEAANLALKALATGGVYVGGGIAPKILPALEDGTFLRAFVGCGPLAPLLARMPVKVILEPDAALIGASGLALSLAG